MNNQSSAAIDATGGRVAEVLRQAALHLVAGGIESGRLDAEVLLAHVLHVSRDKLPLLANESLSAAQRHAYAELVARRRGREPAAYITGTREFWSLAFHVTPDVLIPRPETERLVEIALGRASRLVPDGRLRIADVGTGSGCVAVTLAKELPRAEIVAIDLSLPALRIARRNAARHGVADRIEFVRSDFFQGIGFFARFHLIVANPPYIPALQIAELEPEVSRWEPRVALTGGTDGLDAYRRLAAEAVKYLAADGEIAVEIGAGMATSVAELFEASAWDDIRVDEDYAGVERVVSARARPFARGRFGG